VWSLDCIRLFCFSPNQRTFLLPFNPEDDMTEESDDTKSTPEWEFDADDPAGISEGIGVFLDSTEEDDAAFDSYVPIKPPQDDEDDDTLPPVYFSPPHETTASEHYETVPARARSRFWTYRRELYEQMEFALIRFAQTELGDAWLCSEGWTFHTIRFATETPYPKTSMDLRHLTNREAAAYYAKMDAVVPNELSKIANWQDAIRRCTLRLLGDSAAHAIRIATVLLEDDPTNNEATLYRNLIGKAETFLGPEESEVGDWGVDALKFYAV